MHLVLQRHLPRSQLRRPLHLLAHGQVAHTDAWEREQRQAANRPFGGAANIVTCALNQAHRAPDQEADAAERQAAHSLLVVDLAAAGLDVVDAASPPRARRDVRAVRAHVSAQWARACGGRRWA